MRTIAAITFFGLLVIAGACSASSRVVISAQPTVKVESTGDETKRYTLSPQEMAKYPLLITEEDGNFFWASRDNRPMIHTQSGMFHYYIAVDGAGYVKVWDATVFAKKGEPPVFPYLENLSIMLNTITYWGSANAFTPGP